MTYLLRTVALAAGLLAGIGAAAAQTAKVDVPLPPEVAAAKRLVIGIHCAYPPAGYVDLNGKPAGYEYTLVKRIADFAFGSGDGLVTQCVNDSNRIPFLQSGKVDLVLASLAYTPARAEQLDYSDPIWISNLQLVVKDDSPIATYSDLDGKTVVTPTGSTYQTWLQKCYPKANLVTAQSPSESSQLLKQGRADAFAYIDVYDYNFTLNNPGYKVVGPLASSSIQGIGVKKGNTAMRDWVNAVLAQMRSEDAFFKAFQAEIKDPALVAKYRDKVPGPNVTLDYTKGSPFDCL